MFMLVMIIVAQVHYMENQGKSYDYDEISDLCHLMKTKYLLLAQRLNRLCIKNRLHRKWLYWSVYLVLQSFPLFKSGFINEIDESS